MRRYSDESGNVALIVAFALVVLMGMLALVADLGDVYLARERDLNALDAGALAGVAQIFAGTAAVTQAAQQYVAQNGGTVDRIVVNPSANTVDLYSTQTVPLHFAEVFGQSSAMFTVHSQAEAGTLVAGNGFAPLAVVRQPFVFGQTYQLTTGPGEGSDGNYGLLQLGAPGAAQLEQNLLYGYSGTLSVDEQVPTETGIASGQVRDALNQRLQEGSACTFATATESCPRVLLLPVINALPEDGKKLVTIVGFAAFYLDGLGEAEGHTAVSGQFMKMIVPGTLGAGENFGLYTVRLSQ